MIALHEWAKRRGMSYSQARKLFLAGIFPEAQTMKNVQNKPAVYVPEDMLYEPSSTVECRVCGKLLTQITNSHLRSHDMTLNEYKNAHPDASIVSTDVSAAIAAKAVGRERTAEHNAAISRSKKGQTPWNKGISGVITASTETRAKQSFAHTGLKHSEESKAKIGDGHRGKYIPPETIERARQGIIEWYRNNSHPFTGKQHTPESKEKFIAAAAERWSNTAPELIAQWAEERAKKTRGQRRTDVQKQTYREARVKWMSENPTKVINTTGERSIAEWLDAHRINYVRQFVIPDFWHPYDFFVPDHNTIIEFDGAHHWWRSWFNVLGKTKAERDEMLRHQMEKDAMENLVAGLSGYRIIRVRGVADSGDSSEYGSLEQQLCLQGFIF